MGEAVPMLAALATLSLFVTAALWLRARGSRRKVYLARFDFAALLDRQLARRRPEFDAAQRHCVLEGLREWFGVCQAAKGRKVSMPSQAVDDAWHEFILFTRHYQIFCRRALGRFLHHVPAEAMSSPHQASDGLRRAWKLSCQRARIDPRAPAALPLLFAIDGELGLADGFRYELDCLARGGAGRGTYCAGGIGCSSCGSCSGDAGGDGGDGGCGGGCGGD